MGSPLVSPFDTNTLPQIIIPRLPVTNFMPAGGEDFEAHGYVLLPAIGASAVVVAVPIPEGRMAMVKRIANVFVGGGFQEGQGGVVWQILLDGTNPNNPVVAPFFDNIVASLGAVNNPSAIDGIRVREGNLLQLIVKNVSVAVAGQFIGGRLGGYFYPIELDPTDASF
jgi:hypothetical protein